MRFSSLPQRNFPRLIYLSLRICFLMSRVNSPLFSLILLFLHPKLNNFPPSFEFAPFKYLQASIIVPFLRYLTSQYIYIILAFLMNQPIQLPNLFCGFSLNSLRFNQYLSGNEVNAQNTRHCYRHMFTSVL